MVSLFSLCYYCCSDFCESQTLAAKAKGIGRLGPVVPPTKENLENAIADGYNMIIVSNDMWHFQKALREMMNTSVNLVRPK